MSHAFSQIPEHLRARGHFIQSLKQGLVVKLADKTWGVSARYLLQSQAPAQQGLTPESLGWITQALDAEEAQPTGNGHVRPLGAAILYKWIPTEDPTSGFLGIFLPEKGERIELHNGRAHLLSLPDLWTASPLGSLAAKRLNAILARTPNKYKGKAACTQPATGSAEGAVPTRYVIGIDETARGTWAGPLVAAAVVYDREQPNAAFARAQDCKGLTDEALEQTGAQLAPIPHALGIISTEEINHCDPQGHYPNLDTLHQQAFLRALGGIDPAILAEATILVDGTSVQLPDSFPHVRYIPQGEKTSQAIAAASILARNWFDAHMREAHTQYPHWCFHQHKGYGTPQHKQKLERHGACPLHRRSFKPVRRAADAAAVAGAPASIVGGAS